MDAVECIEDTYNMFLLKYEAERDKNTKVGIAVGEMISALLTIAYEIRVNSNIIELTSKSF